MITKPVLDPFEMWRQIINKIEAGTSAIAKNTPNSEQFARASQQFTQVSAGMQQSFGKALDNYFKAVRVPGLADFVALEEQMQRLEAKVDDLLAAVNKPAETTKPATGAGASATTPPPTNKGA
ncbi:hypothetical protein GCM10019059_43240 [Camelimonas fluminis]|uniref:Poly(3-hydroxyalkanoate) polymerase subunit PhaE n=1 Tax=Camelimonas fluminis TaxID=1576911 RepID=A0ABV7UH19_9HYPH|nr:hypothetical protein [Camelimonas fluminis]GHE80351.1 hypothetical protein GCM10019059_43240 [Camelimonas fluminis]